MRLRGKESLEYFNSRAEQEIAAAQAATHPDAVRAHYMLAGFYRDLVQNGTATSVVDGRETRRPSLSLKFGDGKPPKID